MNSVISQHYARTNGTIVIYNESDQPASANFRLHLPETAYVSGLMLTVNGETFVGEVKEMAKARADFAQAIDRGDVAGLLESRGTNLFELVVNVAPGSTAEFELSYDELLRRVGGEISYKLVLDPGQIVPDFQVSVSIAEEAELEYVTCTLPAATIEQGELATAGQISTGTSSGQPRNARILLSPSEAEQRQMGKTGLSEEMVISYDTTKASTATSDVGLLLHGDGYFLHYFSADESHLASVNAPGPLDDAGGESETTSDDSDGIPKHIVFVVDSSGSMSGDKMQQTKDAFKEIISAVRSQDWFSVIQFDNDIYRCCNDDRLMAASAANKDKAISYIAEVSANGGTNIQDAAVAAFTTLQSEHTTGAQDIVILLTDGQATVDLSRVAAANPSGGSLLFTLGLGDGVDYNLLRALALSNGGFYRQIYAESDAAEQVVDFYSEVSTPLLMDLVFTYDPPPEPATLTTSTYSSLMEGSEVMVGGKLPQGGVETMSVSVQAMGAMGSVGYSDVISLTESSEQLKNIGRRAWALLQIEELLQVMALRELDEGGAEEAREAALALALEEQLVVEGLTSLVVVATHDEDETEEEEEEGESGWE